MEAGILPEDELRTYGMDDSRMPMSGMASYTPGMEITGGSLGHGLGIAVGMALGLKRKNNPAFVYNLMSDGELGEGSTWEAAMAASACSICGMRRARSRFDSSAGIVPSSSSHSSSATAWRACSWRRASLALATASCWTTSCTL